MADKPAQAPRPFGARIAGSGTDPPADKFRHPAVRIGIAAGPHIRPAAGQGPIAAQQVEKLRLRKMRQLVKAQKADLRALPVELVLFMLQMSKTDGAARGKPPAQGTLARRAAQFAIET